MQKVLFLAGLTVVVTSLSAQAAGTCMSDVRANGLQVFTSPDYPPFESLDKNNAIVGFDVDLINLLAQKMKVKATITGQSFDGLIPSLLAKKAHLVAAGMTITDERKKSVDFSLPYVSGPNAIVVRKENTNIKKLGDLSGKTVAVQIGSAQEKVASSVSGANVKSYNLYTDAALAVQTRQTDAMVVHNSVAKQFVKVYPDLKIAAQVGSINTGFAIRKDCSDLTNQLNAALIQTRKSGEMEKLVAKWFK